MKCPIDGSDLLMTERQGIEIDYCPKCRGVWLDRGELDKILERTAAEAPPAAAAPPPQQPQPAPQYPPQYHDPRHHQYPKYKKRKSLLGEIFDF